MSNHYVRRKSDYLLTEVCQRSIRGYLLSTVAVRHFVQIIRLLGRSGDAFVFSSVSNRRLVVAAHRRAAFAHYGPRVEAGLSAPSAGHPESGLRPTSASGATCVSQIHISRERAYPFPQVSMQKPRSQAVLSVPVKRHDRRMSHAWSSFQAALRTTMPRKSSKVGLHRTTHFACANGSGLGTGRGLMLLLL
jgi:hypothetical protein